MESLEREMKRREKCRNSGKCAQPGAPFTLVLSRKLRRDKRLFQISVFRASYGHLVFKKSPVLRDVKRTYAPKRAP
jgi:hypothetical protein